MSRIKLAYPKMPGSKDSPDGQCIAFEKYDGTNLHWVWDPELGWYAFGVRRNRYDLDKIGIAEFNAAHPGMEDAVSLFQAQLIPVLGQYLSEHPEIAKEEVIVFTEFLGDSSFAGMHKAGDLKKLVLLDVRTDQGFMPPEEFTQTFDPDIAARVVLLTMKSFAPCAKYSADFTATKIARRLKKSLSAICDTHHW